MSAPNREYFGFPVNDLQEIAVDLDNDYWQFHNKTILLLGGSGFLGTAFKTFFLFLNDERKIDCNVISVDNYIGRNKPREYFHPRLVNIDHDLTVPLGLKLADKKIDFILNASGCAAPHGPSGYSSNPIETMDVSTVAVKHLLELGLTHKARILNFSSSEVVGDADVIPTPEDVIPKVHTTNKRAPYDVTKLYIETISWVFKTKYNLNAVVIRPFNCIGYFRQGDYRVIPNFMSKVLKKQKMPVFLPGTQTRTFCFYTDFLVGAIKVLLRGSDLIYHIGNPNNEISMKDLAFMVERVAGESALVDLIETPPTYLHEPQRRCPSIEKARKELNFEPKVQLPDMLTRIYKWCKNNYV